MVAVVGSTPAEEVQLSLEVLWEMAVKEAKDFYEGEWAEEPERTMLTQVLMEVRVHMEPELMLAEGEDTLREVAGRM